MASSPPRPSTPLWVLALLTFLVILGAFLAVRWVIGTITFAINSILILVVLGGAAYLWLRYKADR